MFNGGFGAPAVTSTGIYASYPCSTYDFQPLTGTQIFLTNTGCEGGGGATPSWPMGSFTPAGEFQWGRLGRQCIEWRCDGPLLGHWRAGV